MEDNSPATGADAGHYQYGDGSAQLVWGLDSNGRLRHVKDVVKGLACGCRCPACRSPLIARHPKKKVCHFAHDTNTECSGGPETALHILAKEVLEEHKRLWIPAVEAMVGSRVERTHEAREMDFDAATLELRLDGVTPDIVLRHGDKELVVEIYVTHACEPEKIAKLAALRLPGVEIDLHAIRRDSHRHEVAEAVISKAPRTWLWNGKREKAEEKLLGRIAEETREKQRKLDRQANAFLEQYDKRQSEPFADQSALEPTVSTVIELGFGNAVSYPTKVEKLFRVRSRAWQSVLFKRFIISKYPDRVWRADFDVTRALTFLEQCKIIPKLFEQDVPEDVRGRIEALCPNFATPREAVAEYLSSLVNRGFLSCRNGSYEVTDRARKKVKEREESIAAAAQRATHLEDYAKIIMARVAPATRSEFDLSGWIHTLHPPLGRSPSDLAKAGDAEWHQLRTILVEIEWAFWSDKVPATLLDLPVGPAIEAEFARRAAERERARQAEEAQKSATRDAREQNLVQAARCTLGDDADTWLDAPVGQESRREIGRSSSQGLDRLLGELDREHGRREEAARMAAESKRVIAQYTEIAIEELGPERARLLLHGIHPKLGNRRPIEVLADPRNLQHCLDATLPKRSRSRR